MFLSQLKKLDWKFYQGSRIGNDTGVLTLYAPHPDNTKKKELPPLVIEMGWLVMHRLGEDKKIIRNDKHRITSNFSVDPEPDGLTLDKFVESLDWRKLLAPTLPEDFLK